MTTATDYKNKTLPGGFTQEQLDNQVLMKKYTTENGGYTINPDGSISPKNTQSSAVVVPQNPTPTNSQTAVYGSDGNLSGYRNNATGVFTPIASRYSSPALQTEANHYKDLNINSVTPQDETAIRADIAKQMQSQLDAIDTQTADLIARETAAGNTRLTSALGKDRATNARAGLFGSPMGDTNINNETKGQTDFTNQNIKTIQDQQNLKKQAILDKIDARAQDTINAKKLEVAGNFTAWSAYQDKVRSKAFEDSKGLATSGVSLEQLKNNPDYYNQLITESGQPQFVFDQTYNNNVKASQKIDYNYTWKGDNLVATGVDPMTGKLVAHTYKADELGIPNTVDPAFQTNENTGQMYWYDKSNPALDEKGNLVLKPIGQFKKVVTKEPKAPNLYALPTNKQIVIKGIQEQIDNGTLSYGDAATKYGEAAPYLNPKKGATLSPAEQLILNKLGG